MVEQDELGAVASVPAPGAEPAGRLPPVARPADGAADQVLGHRLDRVDDLQRPPDLVRAQLEDGLAHRASLCVCARPMCVNLVDCSTGPLLTRYRPAIAIIKSSECQPKAGRR